MTPEEFRSWFSYHAAAFPGVITWLDKATKGPNAPTQRAILAQWARALEACDLSAAKAATDKMHSGEIEEPKGFDRHPAAIRQAAGVSERLLKRPWEEERYEGGRRVYTCLTCLDCGFVQCWDTKSMHAAKDGTLGKHFTLYSCAVPCTCEAGRDWQRRSRLTYHFDARRWLSLHRIEDGREVLGFVSDESEQERLREFVAAIKPANYESAFDSYGG